MKQLRVNPGIRNRTPAERAIIYAAGLSNASLEELDALLVQVGARPMNPNSYSDLVKLYTPYFREEMARLKYAIEHPPTRDEVKAGQISYIFRRAA